MHPGWQPHGAHPLRTWQQALNQLEGQMPRETFDRLLRGSYLLATNGSTWTIAVPNPLAVDWLVHRLDGTLRRTVSYYARRPVALRYVAAARQPAPPRKGQRQRQR
jgi:chromosomal replication initiation ATPase DnaA